MQKDEYAMLKARQEIVKAFIEKLESASIEDVSLIPALMDYVQTGDRSMFEEYNKFRAAKSEEERRKFQNYVEKMLKENDEQRDRIDEYKKEYTDYITKYNAWLKEVCFKMDEDTPQIGRTFGAIIKFINERAESSSSWRERVFYVRIGDKLHNVKDIEFVNHKAVLTLGSLSTMLPSKPQTIGYRSLIITLTEEKRK
jgi:hypothetical protein